MSKISTTLMSLLFKPTHLRILIGEKASSNKTPVLIKSTNMGIWVVVTSNQLFIRGSKFSKK